MYTISFHSMQGLPIDLQPSATREGKRKGIGGGGGGGDAVGGGGEEEILGVGGARNNFG